MKKLALLFVFFALPAFAQNFSVLSRGPLSGNCPPKSLGLDFVNNNVYSCGDTVGPTPPSWKLTTGSGAAGLADPGSNGVIKRTALNVTAPATFADVVLLWASGSCAGYLFNDGTCSTPSGTIPSGTQGYPWVNTNGSTGIGTSGIYVDASQFSGTDMCAKIKAARASASCGAANAGCVVYAPFLGKQSCGTGTASDPFNGWGDGGILALGGAQVLDIRLSQPWNIPPATKVVGTGTTGTATASLNTSNVIIRAGNPAWQSTAAVFAVPSESIPTISVSGTLATMNVTTSLCGSSVPGNGGSPSNGQDIAIFGGPGIFAAMSHAFAINIAGCGVILSGTYTSHITATGTVGQTCNLASFNDNGSGATATVALTGTNTIAGGTALVITNGGSGYNPSPTTAVVSNGTATCTGTGAGGTATISTIATTTSSSFQLPVPSGTSNCASSCGSLYEGTPLINIGLNPPTAAQYRTQLEGFSLDCGWVLGCFELLNNGAEEDSWFRNMNFYNSGMTALRLTQYTTAGFASGGTSGGGDSQSGPYYDFSINFLPEKCELGGGCGAVAQNQNIYETSGAGTNAQGQNPLGCFTNAIVLDGPRTNAGGGPKTVNHVNSINSFTISASDPDPTNVNNPNTPIAMNDATCGTPYGSPGAGTTPIGILTWGVMADINNFHIEDYPAEIEIGGNPTLNFAYPGSLIGRTSGQTVALTNGVRISNGATSSGSANAWQIDIGANAGDILIGPMSRFGGTHLINSNPTGHTCTDLAVTHYALGNGNFPSEISTCGGIPWTIATNQGTASAFMGVTGGGALELNSALAFLDNAGNLTVNSCAGCNIGGAQALLSDATATTVNANTTSPQIMKTYSGSLGQFNANNKAITFDAGGTFSAASGGATISFCFFAASCPTVISVPSPSASSPYGWNLHINCQVRTSGTSGVVVCYGQSSYYSTTGGTTVALPFPPASISYIQTGNLNTNVSPEVEVTFSSASASNTATTNAWLVNQWN